jgi:hypothetical protein
MLFKNTKQIKKDDAIDRIFLISQLKIWKNYREIKNITAEYGSVEKFINDTDDFIISKLELYDWTVRMLENQINQPFYRLSLFENYIIE